MKITALVENQTHCDLHAVHGLSLYIETKRHKLLFDLGPDDTLFVNAAKRKIDLSLVDTVIISHGHDDHGGALGQFLKENHQAIVYIQKRAFEPHYTKGLLVKSDIGLDPALKDHPQVKLVNGDAQIDEELSLITVSCTDQCYSSANDTLYEGGGKDHFEHEQSLLIQ